MKVFYQVVPRPKGLLEQPQVGMEDINVPLKILSAVHASLEQSTSLIPGSARRFQDWRVGLLERFDVEVGSRTDLTSA